MYLQIGGTTLSIVSKVFDADWMEQEHYSL
jgi:hypothetical protein